jgi:dolichyl-diphosphooligosaccharide--protein glycosyltransferase
MDAALLPLRLAFKLVLIVLQAIALVWFLFAAYDIRLYPIKDFGYIIHEFDPWFNYRAAEYLAEHGLDKFFKWYDYESWYPLGRPIGTTIYPGMQMTAVAIWEAMKQVPEFTMPTPFPILAWKPIIETLSSALGLGYAPRIPDVIEYAPLSVNDICCLIPPWFGSVASLLTGLLAYEISRSVNAGVASVGIMAVIPAHLMRSVGGEFDNEAVAMAAISGTFWLWCRSVRNSSSWVWAPLAGLSYGYMVAAWGGYIFVLNMIGLHAAMLVGLGRFNFGVYKAYTIFFVIGTYLATRIPVVGMSPLRSLEQIGPLLVFGGYQVLAFCDWQRKARGLSKEDFFKFRINCIAGLAAALVGVAILLYPTGYFGPLSSRIRGLFMKHTKTGNPLVDSVAEHQPASPSMYMSYLHLPLDYALFGGLAMLPQRNNGFYFMVLYGLIAQHFSGKMSRLMIICAPITSVAAGIWAGFVLDVLTEPFLMLLGKPSRFLKPDDQEEAPSAPDGAKEKESGGSGARARGQPKDAKGKAAATKDEKKEKKKAKEQKKSKSVKWELPEWEDELRPSGAGDIKRAIQEALGDGFGNEMMDNYVEIRKSMDAPSLVAGRAAFSILIFLFLIFGGTVAKIHGFVYHCDRVAQSLSNPQVVYMVQDRYTGRKQVIDDYLKGYQWIDANTPKDARVMAWWDYGYQITGIAKRTSIADGNTWNHEHIATLGRTLTSPEKKAWNTIRHLADYVLVWAGGGGDDLAKSPHLARIGNSVFPDHCGDDDPRCNKFSFYSDGSPTPMMARSLLYKLCQFEVTDGVKVDPKLFEKVHDTQHGLMRVYKVQNISQESKEWIADPSNRECDAPGSWYCVGKYPPALEQLISKRRNFAQLEDFNNKGGEKSAYAKLIEKERAGGGGNADL